MKLLICFAGISFLLFINACSAPSVIVKKTVEQTYTNTVFEPQLVEKSIGNNVNIVITPIDAISINQETCESAQRDGNYEKEFALQFDKIKSDLNNITSKVEQQRQKSKIKAIEYIKYLIDNRKIAPTVGYQLQYRILFGKEYGGNGLEISSLSENETYTSIYNPYRINNKYLSVFKITYTNNGDKVRSFNIDDLQISSGEELLYPLKNQYFEDIFPSGSDLLKNTYRMNMPNELTITPEQKVTKYISIPALNRKNNTIRFQMIEKEVVTNFDFKMEESNLSKSYLLENFQIVPKNNYSEPSLFYYAIEYVGGTSFATINDNVFIPIDKFNSILTVHCITINEQAGVVRYGQLKNFVPNTIKNHKIPILSWN